jgi:type IV secretory pathway VirB10-like protein
VEAVEEQKEQTEREAVESVQPTKAENHSTALIIPEGTEIPAITLGAINGELTGPVDAETRSNVYVPGTREIAIPQGAKLLGHSTEGRRFESTAVSGDLSSHPRIPARATVLLD